MGHSSLASGSLKSSSSRSTAQPVPCIVFYVSPNDSFGGIAILDEHTRLTCLETNASISAAFGTAGVDLVHLEEYLDNFLSIRIGEIFMYTKLVERVLS